MTASAIQREIRQRRPFSSSSQEALVGLLRTTDLLRRDLTRVVEARDLTLQQYNVMRILRGAGEQGLPTLEIAERMIEQAPGVTRLLSRLVAKRLVRRRRCRQDRRQVLCWITATGLTLLREVDGPLEQAAETALGVLDSRELATLIRLLDRIRAGAPEG